MSTRREVIAAFGAIPFARSKQLRGGGLRMNVIRNGRSNRRYLHIHGDESTAREVLTAHMKTNAGVAFLVDNGQRNFSQGGLQFDPNRIWSHVGALANIDRLNPRISWAERLYLMDRLDEDRERLQRAILPPASGLLLALHNNAHGYSVQDELAISDKTGLTDAVKTVEQLVDRAGVHTDSVRVPRWRLVRYRRSPKRAMAVLAKRSRWSHSSRSSLK